MKILLKSIVTALMVVASLPLVAQNSLWEAYRDYWYTGVSVNQWQTEPGNTDWAVITRDFNWAVAENCMKCEVIHPKEGVYDFTLADRPMRLWRMPSSSRAYPMKLEDKATHYRKMMIKIGLL